MVVIPTLASAIYFGAVASDVYVSESRFVVRSTERPEAPSLGALMKGGGITPGMDNAQVVHDYILSREAMTSVQKTTDIKGAYSNGHVDFLSRFPGLFDKNNFETFFEYYKKYVSVTVDPASSVAVLTVRAFSPEMAKATNEAILTRAEDLVNQLNKRMTHDVLATATEEVATAEDRVKKLESELSKFRGSQNVVDPEKQAALQLERSDKLSEVLLAAETRLDQVRAVAKDSPQVTSLQRQVKMIRRAIRENASSITGGQRSLVENTSEYHRLSLNRELAAKQLAVAMERLDRAQDEAAQKHAYLERIAQPSSPDGALEPYRIRGVLATLVVGLLVWGVLSVLGAGIREHRGDL